MAQVQIEWLQENIHGISSFSERYPMSSQLVGSNMVPEFDNLYLDMNGIIHNCAKEYDPEKEGGQRTEEEIFIAIFSYIQTLFEIIRPQRLFFLAVDGVAPRAKMNQQRARRFRAALEAEQEAEKEAKRMASKGQVKSATAEPKFDGNCITPGTEFMHRMSQHLRYFIAKKVHEEPSWQGIEVIFSGPDVPGEGEHKIMEYIRCSKAQPDYNPNLRHCLYGLDADLILLGLLSHDPHFALLREEVLFGPASRKPKSLAQTRFFLMHLELLRDYLDDEFRSFYASQSGALLDYKKGPFEHYSVERIIDDFILMTIFVGNDFLPGLPYFHINENAIGMMFEAYKEFLKTSNGRFMNNSGVIDFKLAASFLSNLGFLEREHFNKTLASINAQQAKSKSGIPVKHKALYEKIKAELILNEAADTWKSTGPLTGKDKTFVWNLAVDFNLHFGLDEQHHVLLSKALGSDDDEDEAYSVDQVMLGKYDAKKSDNEADLSSDEGGSEEFMAWKAEFYKEKLHMDTIGDSAGLLPLVKEYLRGIQWNMFYYYKGVVDWAWYFPYHYGPYLTDVVEVMRDFQCEPFKMGQPYSPLEQLLAVLPAASAAHVPKPFAELMTDPYSPIIDFYPRQFEQDQNGKKAPWEAVVLIPFIDELRLLTAVESVVDQLDAEEVERNKYGSSTLIKHCPSASLGLEPPPRSSYKFVQGLQVSMLQYDLPVLETEYSFKPELLPGVKPVAGFPSLKNLIHKARLDTIGINLFGGKPTSSISLVLTLKDFVLEGTVEELARKICGQRMYGGWPFLQEGIVSKITDGLFAYEKNDKRPLNELELSEHSRTVVALTEDYRRMKAIEIDDIELLVWISPLTGMRRDSAGATKKVYAHPSAALPFPAQIVLPPSACIEDPRYAELAAKTPEEEYPVGSPCIFMGTEHFGTTATVTGHSNGGVDLAIERRVPVGLEPSFPYQLAHSATAGPAYFPARLVAEKLGVPPLFLSKIASGWYLFFGNDMEKSSNLGLGLKFDGRGQRASGYTRRVQGSWEFSEAAVTLIRTYLAAFPNVARALIFNVRAQQTQATAIFGASVTKNDLTKHLEPIKAWIKEKCSDISLVPIDTNMLAPETVTSIQEAWAQYAKEHTQTKSFTLKGVSTKLLKHEGLAQFILPAGKEAFHLGDRVRYCGSGASGVPFGASGVIVGLDGESSGAQAMAHVLLDEPLPGVGRTLSGLCPSNFGVLIPRRYLINLNTGGGNVRKVTERMEKVKLAPKAPVHHAPAANGQKPNEIPPALSTLFTAAAIKTGTGHGAPSKSALAKPAADPVNAQKPGTKSMDTWPVVEQKKPGIQAVVYSTKTHKITQDGQKKPEQPAPTQQNSPVIYSTIKKALLKPDLTWTK